MLKLLHAAAALALVGPYAGLFAAPLAAQSTALAAAQEGDGAQPQTSPEAKGDDPARFTGADLFGLSVAASPQISPDGRAIAYVRRTNDIMSDRAVSSIWLIDVASGAQTPLATRPGSHSSPRWSPDGKRIAYISTEDGGGPELYVHWLDRGSAAKITALPDAPRDIAWSPDGSKLAFSVRVAEPPLKLGEAPPKPEGAEWGKPLQVIDTIVYRRDGQGYLKPGTTQIFLVDAAGGAPRQLTYRKYNHGGALEWSRDGKTLFFSANRKSDWELEPLESEIYALDIASGAIRALTKRKGPDYAAQVSPDGTKIAYLGFDDVGHAFDQTRLYVMNADGSGAREIAGDFDRSFDAIEWTEAGLFASYEDRGTHRVARVSLDGKLRALAPRLGSPYYALPYVGGEWSVSRTGAIAFTTASADAPPDVGVWSGRKTRQLTALNALKLSAKRLGQYRKIDVRAHDGTPIDAWLMLPPDYKPGARVPMILEMHGGPYASYGPEFSADYQLYGAAGYAVLFTNPGGSTGYGEAFADRIEGNYPISNFDELMAAVNAAIAQGFADPDQLFVTGGSGGGVLTSWIVGKTDRFRAAATHKPVINWVSQALMADGTPFFGRYWLGAMPWEKPEDYWKRSPLSLVGNVKTPTLVLVGADDYRTPRSEAEQYYGALKLAGVDTALVITPDSSHNNLSQTPSQQAARTAAVIAWFDKYRRSRSANEAEGASSP